jgi:High potential iron-sulfur protein
MLRKACLRHARVGVKAGDVGRRVNAARRLFPTPTRWSCNVNLSNRRVFMMSLAAGTSALAAGAALAQAKLDEKDPQAVALGYVADTAKADAKKFPKHSKDQNCANCQLFQGKPKDATGGCPLFAGKVVAAAGWCSAWVKKA